MVAVTDSTNITVSQSELKHIGGWSLWIRGGSKHVTMSQCSATDSAIGGVYLDGCGAQCGNNSVIQSRLSYGGLVVPQGVGIHVSCCANSTISRNEISGFHGKGIVLRGSPRSYFNASAVDYWERDICSQEWNCVEQTLIEDNHIHDLVNGTLSDKVNCDCRGGSSCI